MLEELLFRGILPFAFHDVGSQDDNGDYDIISPYDDNIDDFNRLMKKICVKYHVCDESKEDDDDIDAVKNDGVITMN